MNRFIGNIDAKADAKGRVFIPAAFRKILQVEPDTRLVLRKDTYEKCIVLYPVSVWEEELSYLRSKLNRFNEEEQRLYRQYTLNIELVEMDSNGRILIPKRYMKEANISSEVRFVGVDNTIEIWTNDALDKTLIPAGEFGSRIQALMNNSSQND